MVCEESQNEGALIKGTENDMKAGHRHELKTNELAQWIAEIPRWVREHLKIIIIVSVVVVIAAGALFHFRYQKRALSVREQLRLTELTTRRLAQSKIDIISAHDGGGDLAFLLLQLADNLRTFADGARSDDAAALALIKRGDALRAELHYRAEMVNRQNTAVVDQIEQAKKSYSDALERSSSNASLKAMASLGLGLCEEELGNFEEAGRIYRGLVENPQFEGTAPVVQARERLETMGDYRKEVAFRAAPRPTVRPPTPTPRIPLRLPDVNIVDVTVPQVNLGPVRTDTNLVEPPLSETGSPDTGGAGPGLAEANAGGS